MKVAICLKGAVSKKGGADERFYHQNDLYRCGEYIDYIAVRDSIFKHIVDANPKHEFDFFLHGWNLDLEKDLVRIYKPKKYHFEDNNLYSTEILSMITSAKDFGGVSGSLSLKKSIQLKEEYEENEHYDMVIIYRYDVLIWKNINLDLYDVQNSMYVNSWNGSCRGDFHFVMSNNVSKEFKFLYDSVVAHKNVHQFHHWIHNYIVNIMKWTLKEDLIKPGVDQEHVRVISARPHLFPNQISVLRM